MQTGVCFGLASRSSVASIAPQNVPQTLNRRVDMRSNSLILLVEPDGIEIVGSSRSELLWSSILYHSA